MLAARLVLFDWLIHQLGAKSFEELRSAVNRPELEGFTPDKTTRFAPEIEHLLFDRPGTISPDELLIDSREILVEMDANIVRHWKQIAEKRTRLGQEIFPTYFQYLCLLAAELYLRGYVAERGRLVFSLNSALQRFNTRLKETRDRVPDFTDADLNHLALWNATGSGKTLLMHINLLQFRHYLSRFPRQAPRIDQVILITPNERLSEQHLAELALSGISAQRFSSSGGALDMFRGIESAVQVIEIHKLAEETKEKTVNIEEFETSNLVFIDEGHKGTGTDGGLKDQGAWVRRRDRLSATGFSFEYSATFGQALQEGGRLEERYAKSILFEYSYPRFYHDGYGKEYRIMNMPAAANRKQEEAQVRTYLFANLIWFYQQMLVYQENHHILEPFRIHKPLLAFVGSSVVKAAADDLSDVATVVQALAEFAENRNDAAVETITQILAGTIPLYDGSGKSVFEGEFRFLQDHTGVFSQVGSQPETPESAARRLYTAMKQALFHGTVGDLSIERLTGSAETEGELILRLGASEKPFAVITVGDAKKLADHLERGSSGEAVARVSERAISDSYFRSINDNSSPITVLIGAKKFIEGWSSWRVSSIGLMKIGQSQGPQVIQLFGRGVRLQGFDFRLKRAHALPPQDRPSLPQNIDYVETLSVFGVRAAYIEKFKEIIEEEEGALEYEIVEIPRKRVHEERYEDLRYIDLDRTATAKSRLPIWELALPTAEEHEKLRISVTWSVALQAFFSRRAKSSVSPDTHLETGRFTSNHIRFLDLEALHRELVEYKNNERYFNLSISRRAIQELLSHQGDLPWYSLQTPPDTLRFDHAGRIEEWQEIAQVLLRNYVKRFYEYRRASFENGFLKTRPLTNQDGGLAQEQVFAYLPKSKGTDEVEDRALEQAIERVRALVEQEWNGRDSRGDEPADAGVSALRVANHVYYPLLHLNRDDTTRFSPQGLNDGEMQFVRDLTAWFRENETPTPDSEAFFFRNESRGRGLGFFIADNFYPDFILWLHTPGMQTMVFIDPKGIRNLGGFDHPKLRFHATIKDIEKHLNAGRAPSEVSLRLESFIISTTPYDNVMWNHQAGEARRSKPEFEERHVLFMGDGNYVVKMMNRLG